MHPNHKAKFNENSFQQEKKFCYIGISTACGGVDLMEARIQDVHAPSLSRTVPSPEAEYMQIVLSVSSP